MKDTLLEIKNNLQGNNSRMDEAKSHINDVENKEAKTSNHGLRARRKKNKKIIRSLWDNFECSNIHIIGVPEEEDKEQEIENLFEKIMKENFPDWVKEVDMQVQEAQSPKQDGCKEAHCKTYQLKCQRLKRKRKS